MQKIYSQSEQQRKRGSSGRFAREKFAAALKSVDEKAKGILRRALKMVAAQEDGILFFSWPKEAARTRGIPARSFVMAMSLHGRHASIIWRTRSAAPKPNSRIRRPSGASCDSACSIRRA